MSNQATQELVMTGIHDKTRWENDILGPKVKNRFIGNIKDNQGLSYDIQPGIFQKGLVDIP